MLALHGRTRSVPPAGSEPRHKKLFTLDSPEGPLGPRQDLLFLGGSAVLLPMCNARFSLKLPGTVNFSQMNFL